TKSTNLDRLSDFNQPIIANGVSTGVVPYPNFGYIEYLNQNGYGNYNGLEASLLRRFHNGLDLRATYTYSRSLTTRRKSWRATRARGPMGVTPPPGRGRAISIFRTVWP